ncbi:FkbM family methyltransferase [Vineibacter terrae]|uniref:FkbM family methyltransferase n=1 Tax=Vineibacter terrae TaxID=2586908 RepID=UPI002E2FBF3E|nr:FkbM family methyltransferase [Vineibacter terrae]HEX2888661.1 FkbM family methyltransferase [Vineibacter terrae]
MSVVANGSRWRGVCAHPLHVARRNALFRGVTRLLDFPVLRAVDGIPHPIYLRFGPNLSMWVNGRPAEATELATFDRLIRATNASFFVDVGANIGIYSFWFAAQRSPGHVLALEPDPANVRCLARTTAHARLSGIDIRAIAASDHKGIAVFQFDDVSGLTGQLKSSAISFTERHYGVRPREASVEVDTLDEIMRDGHPDIIKIDVEGAEASVLRGATSTLRVARPCILIELGDGREDSTAVLQQEGYSLCDASNLGPLKPETWNALALPADRAPSILAALRI